MEVLQVEDQAFACSAHILSPQQQKGLVLGGGLGRGQRPLPDGTLISVKTTQLAAVPEHAPVLWHGNTVATLSECGTKHTGVY